MSRKLYQIETEIEHRFPNLSPSERRGLVLWVYGAIQSGSACQNAVANALTLFMKAYAARQALREWLYEGKDKARPTKKQLDVSSCFSSLWKWILDWSQDKTLFLAIDATMQNDKWTALVLSYLCCGTAVPIAWYICEGNTPGEWLTPILHLLERLDKVPERKVMVLTDRGLYSSVLFRAIVDKGFHPLMRLRNDLRFTPLGENSVQARQLVPERNRAWIGQGTAFYDRKKHLLCTLVAVWLAGNDAPCLCLTDLAPCEVEPLWYGMRMWIENGFRNLKSMGFDWERTKRKHKERIERHWLVMAVGQLLLVAYGTRVEEASIQNLPPCRVHRPLLPTEGIVKRVASLVKQGWKQLRHHFAQGRMWKRLWLSSSIPEIPGNLKITRITMPNKAYIPL